MNERDHKKLLEILHRANQAPDERDRWQSLDQLAELTGYSREDLREALDKAKSQGIVRETKLNEKFRLKADPAPPMPLPDSFLRKTTRTIATHLKKFWGWIAENYKQLTVVILCLTLLTGIVAILIPFFTQKQMEQNSAPGNQYNRPEASSNVPIDRPSILQPNPTAESTIDTQQAIDNQLNEKIAPPDSIPPHKDSP